MPDQNKVAFNIPQSKTTAEKLQARENIDAVGLGVQTGDDPFNAVYKMLVHIPTASASGTVSFNGGTTTPLSMVKTPVQSDDGKILRAHHVNGQSFFTWDSVNLDSGRFVVYDIANGTTSVANLYTNIGNTIAAGKLPVIKYEETTNPSQYGYYWPMSVGTLDTNFARVYGGAVKVITVLNNDRITINTYPFDKFDMENLAPQWTSVTFKGDALVTADGHMYRASQNSTPIDTPSGSPNVWTQVDVASLLGRVRDASEEAVVDPNNPTKWEIPNNALCVINTAQAGPLSIEIDIKVYDAEVANAAVNIKSVEGGTVTVKTHRYIANGPNVPPTVTTCYYSKSAGNEIPANKDVQITCVGNRWTWEEYVDPDALNNAKGSNGDNEKEEPLVPVEEPVEKKNDTHASRQQPSET